MKKHENQSASELVSVLVEVQTKVDENTISLMEETDIYNEFAIDLAPFQIDKNFKPIVMRKEPEGDPASPFGENDNNTSTLVIRGMIPMSKIEELKQQENVVEVFPNPKGVIVPMIDQVDCEAGQPKGTLMDVSKYLGVDKIWEKGFKGDNIVIGIVDAGITAEGRANPNDWKLPLVKRVEGGFRDDWGTYTNRASFHGNMTATDALGVAPNAKLFDIRIFEKEGIEESFLDVVFEAS